MTITKKNRNTVLGAGTLFIDPDGNGLREFANTPELMLNVETEVFEDYDADTKVAIKNEEAVTQRDIGGSFTGKDITPENLALFFVGEVNTQSQSALSAETETISGVTLGRTYVIGASDDNPIGARNLSSVTVEVDTTSMVEGSDYELNTDAGLIKILEGGDIAEDDDVDVTYDGEEVDWDQVKTDDDIEQIVELLFVADNAVGGNTHFMMQKINLQPSGDFSIKSREDAQEMGFEFSILEPDTGPAMTADGEPYTP